jgi:hypothetical protein
VKEEEQALGIKGRFEEAGPESGHYVGERSLPPSRAQPLGISSGEQAPATQANHSCPGEGPFGLNRLDVLDLVCSDSVAHSPRPFATLVG